MEHQPRDATCHWESVGPVGRHHMVGWPWWSGNHDGQPAIQRVRSAQILVWRLIGGPSCHVYRFGFGLSQFGGSNGPVDPREHVWFVEKLLPQIHDVSPCSFGLYSPLISKHNQPAHNMYTNTLWNLLAITPTTSVDVRLSYAHAGADSLFWWSGLYLDAWSLFYLHFCLNFNVVIFLRENMELALSG